MNDIDPLIFLSHYLRITIASEIREQISLGANKDIDVFMEAINKRIDKEVKAEAQKQFNGIMNNIKKELDERTDPIKVMEKVMK